MPTVETYHGYPLWHYIPNRPAAIIFTVLFGLATVVHSVLMFRHRTWFCIPFIIGGLCKLYSSPFRNYGQVPPCLYIDFLFS